MPGPGGKWGEVESCDLPPTVASGFDLLDHDVPLSPIMDVATEVAAMAPGFRRCAFSKGPELGATS
jgi:hypothetical protein